MRFTILNVAFLCQVSSFSPKTFTRHGSSLSMAVDELTLSTCSKRVHQMLFLRRCSGNRVSK